MFSQKILLDEEKKTEQDVELMRGNDLKNIVAQLQRR